MGQEGSLPCSQEAATGSYPEPDLSSSHPYILFLKIRLNSMLRPGFQTGISS
jgi:hypothetical protein